MFSQLLKSMLKMRYMTTANDTVLYIELICLNEKFCNELRVWHVLNGVEDLIDEQTEN